ncbi:MAG: DNA topoisomerase IA, partial [Oleiphilaceae bacterium]
ARWVEGVPSYGAYFPSQSKIIDGSAANFLCFGMNYQDSFLFKFIGDHNALDPLLIDSNKSFYLSCASTAFNQNFKDISEVLKALKKKLKYLNKLLELSLNSPSSREQAFIELKRYTLVNKELWDEDSRYKFADELLTKYEKDSNEFSLDDCDRLIDVVLRPELFHISARYWEGKFILSQRELLLSRHPKNLEEALRRLCMLTPCLVSTLHTVGKLAALPKDILEDNDGRSHLFGLFDLLIIDESGQALPELGGAAIALAKRAAIVGDLKQIAPVSSHNELSEKKISQMVFTDEQIELNNFSGRSTLNGSVLAMARKRSVYREPADDGVTLSYHYRCKPSIVEYCNQLSYNGNLVTRTSDDAGKSLLPAMAWVNVDAKAEKVEGSYQNSAEAKEIAEWIVESWPVWQVHEDSKGKPIYDVVAVITPYKRQEKILCSALEKAFNIARKSAKDESNFPSQKEVKDITVGTVHKLQGAERPFVCFSLVEGPDKITNSFVDKTESIMNVAVSRAKKSFIIFANPKRLFPDQSLLISQNIKISDKPVLFLGEYLRKEFKHASHIRMLYPEYLVLIEAEGKVDSLQKVLGKKAEVLDTGGALLSIKQVKGFKKDRLEKNASLIPVFQSKLKEKDNKRLKIEEALKNIDECILATDDDAMGEYIAWQCLLEFSPLMQSKSISRVRLQATTPECIDHAFNSKSELNIGLVTSELLRDMTDFMFMKRCIELKKNALKLSSDQSLLSSFYQIGAIHESAKEFDEAFSMGRVQLAVLGVLYEGMSSVANFKNVKKIEVTLSSEKGTVKGILGRKSLNGDIRYFSENKTLEGSIHKLEKCAITEKIQMPSYRETMDVPIASTINVLRACWAKYGILPNDSMTAMQRLYRGDWCDQTKLNDLKLQNYKSVDIKAKNGSGHPPIQPMLDLPPSQLMNVNIKNIFEVYSIIWEINEALKNKDEFFILHSNREYQLDTKSSAFIVRFENKKLSEPARKVAYLWGINKFQLNDFDAPLCDFPEHMNTSGLGWSIQPAVGWDMSFDSLMEIMKDYGVGRPSTYHSLFNTLINKKMIEVDMAESVRLTPKGFEIINRFSRLSSNLCGYEFTRMAYAQMDLISNGDIDPPEYFQTMIPRLFSDNVDETTHSDVNLSDTWKSIDEIFEFNVNEGMSV